MGPTWFLLVPDGPHVGPMNLAIRVIRVLVIFKNCKNKKGNYLSDPHCRCPFYQRFFCLVSNLMENYFALNPSLLIISLQIFVVVMTVICKFCSDYFSMIWMRAIWDLFGFEWWSKSYLWNAPYMFVFIDGVVKCSESIYNSMSSILYM